MRLYILGGHQKKRWFRPPDDADRFDLALILRLDADGETSERLVEYRTPIQAKAHSGSSSLFTSGTLCGNKLYACTYTEVFVFELPHFRRVTYISLPLFNSLHHVAPTHRGTLLVANTGLDMVVEISLEGKVLHEWNVLGGSPWERFTRNVDYRKLNSTKPHLSHPNFVFQIQEDVWVTRFLQKDAICLTQQTQQIRIGIGRPHDGLLHEGSLYFTTVDGHLVIVNAESLTIRSLIDLRKFIGYPFTGPSWCRGILVVEKGLVCVGFTRIRKTMIMQAANWVKHGFRGTDPPTHIAIFNLPERKCLKTINLESHGVNILFGIFDSEVAHVDEATTADPLPLCGTL
jgi:hypothetical protein